VNLPGAYPDHREPSTLPTPAEIRDMALRGWCSFPPPPPLPVKRRSPVRKLVGKAPNHPKPAKSSLKPSKQALRMPQDVRELAGEGQDSGRVGLI
jgi:hypothetical protein